MADYPFEGQLIADPVTFQRATNAKITVYDAADTTNTTPLALKDASGLPLANPLTSSADAFTQPFYASVADVKMVGAGLTVFVSSAVGLRNAAQTAATAAQQSATSASTAAADRVTTAAVDGTGALVLTKAGGGTINAGNVKGAKGDKGDKGDNGRDGSNVLPTDAAIEQAINNPKSATRRALDTTFGDLGTLAKGGVFDGSTNDTDAVMSAVVAAVHTVELGGKTAMIAGLSFPHGNVTVRNATFVIDGQASNASYAAGVKHDALSGITYENVTFKLAPGANPAVMVRGLAFIGCSNVTLKGCRFEGFTGVPVYAESTDVFIADDCTFNGNNTLSVGTADAGDDYGDLGFFGGSNITVRNCHFVNGGTSVSLMSVKHALIENNNMIGVPANVSAMGVYIMNASEDIVVRENMISSFANEAVVATNVGNTGDPLAVSRRIRVRDNFITECAYAGIAASTAVDDVIIEGNDIRNTTTAMQHGITVTSVTNLKLLNNKVSGASGSYAADITSCDGYEVRGNKLTGSLGSALLSLTLNTNGTVADNDLSVAAGQTGILLYPAASDDYLDLSANRVRGADATAKLIRWTTANNLTRSTITANKFTLGSVDLPVNQVVVVASNIFTTVTGAVVDNGGCVIVNNPGLPA